jgi:hypothetical protein
MIPVATAALPPFRKLRRVVITFSPMARFILPGVPMPGWLKRNLRHQADNG